MKRYILMLLIILTVTITAGCSSSSNEEAKDLKLADILQKFKDGGLETKNLDKPAFAMIGAVDGFIFYNNTNPVKVYEFKSVKTLEEAKNIIPKSKDYPKIGRFLLETDDEKTIEIFSSLKP